MSPVLLPALIVGVCTALPWAPLSVTSSTVPPDSGQAEVSQAEPGGKEGEEDEVPKVDVHVVPGKRWKTSRRALLRMKQRFKQFIHDEIRKVAHEYETSLDNPLPMQGHKSIGSDAIDIYEKILQGPSKPIHPALQTKNPTRFQQISEHGQLSASADESTESAAAALQALFNANKMGTLLDTQQEVAPTEYLSALAEALQQSGDPASDISQNRHDGSISVKDFTEKVEPPVLSAHQATGAADTPETQKTASLRSEHQDFS